MTTKCVDGNWHALFEQQRGRLRGLAYRMLGSVGDADDIVQDAFLRWQRAAADDIASPQAFLTTVVTRLCIDRLRRLQRERIDYSGPWIPEPFVESQSTHGPESELERDETLSLAMLRMFERLAPHERAVFVLREALDLEYADIAAAIDAPVSTCRQWYRRARTHLAGERRFDLAPGAQGELLMKLQMALHAGDVGALIALLHPDIQMRGDGGGKVKAFISVVTGAGRVATVMLHLWRKSGAQSQPPMLVSVNGGLGFATFTASADGGARGAALTAITCIEVADGKLLYFDSVRNPDKLRSFEAQLLAV